MLPNLFVFLLIFWIFTACFINVFKIFIYAEELLMLHRQQKRELEELKKSNEKLKANIVEITKE